MVTFWRLIGLHKSLSAVIPNDSEESLRSQQKTKRDSSRKIGAQNDGIFFLVVVKQRMQYSRALRV